MRARELLLVMLSRECIFTWVMDDGLHCLSGYHYNFVVFLYYTRSLSLRRKIYKLLWCLGKSLLYRLSILGIVSILSIYIYIDIITMMSSKLYLYNNFIIAKNIRTIKINPITLCASDHRIFPRIKRSYPLVLCRLHRQPLVYIADTS